MTIAFVLLWAGAIAFAATGALTVAALARIEAASDRLTDLIHEQRKHAAAATRLEAATDRLETLAHEQVADAKPSPELDPGPLTVDTMEPEDAAAVKKRTKRGYFA